MRSRPGAAPARRRARAAAALGLVLLAGAGAGLVPPWLRAGGTAAAGESAAAEEAETDGGAPPAAGEGAAPAPAAAPHRAPASRAHGHPPLPPAEERAALPPDGGPHYNRLIHERSPYLLQHARNPVDWYPWGEEAFARARAEDKPIFLSIGYSTCHWCHVMERESFEDPRIAALLNEHFVSIKVDREERPDVDAAYMAAVQALTGSGGWPLSVFLTPELEPFWGGTYFPPEERFGRPGFATVLREIARAWRTERAAVLRDAARLGAHVRAALGRATAGELGPEVLQAAARAFAARFDPQWGGFGAAPKFPRPHALMFLLRWWRRSGEPQALAMVETTLARMAEGGIRDQLGGGFHRYATDRRWRVPHFEKMLYDQALLARAYLEAYQATGRERWAEVARQTLEYVLRELADPAGGLYCAEDAESEGEEGRYYTWTRAEIFEVLGPEDGALFARAYGVSADGNYLDPLSGEPTGRNILYLPQPLSATAVALGMEPAALRARLHSLGARLLGARARRVRPHRDDKVLADWNGLAIAALAFAGRTLDAPRYTAAAERAAAFVLEHMVQPEDGRLLHRWREGEAAIPGFLDDYAFMCWGLLELYQTDFELRWLLAARRLARQMVELFYDRRPEGGGFWLAAAPPGERARGGAVGEGGGRIPRVKEAYDGAVPSGNSVAALVLCLLGRLGVDAELGRLAEASLRAFGAQVRAAPAAHPFFLMALEASLGPASEVVIAGPAEAARTRAMLQQVRARFLPNTVVLLRPPGAAGAALAELVPWTVELVMQGGEPTAYVCREQACELPTQQLERFIAQLEAVAAPAAPPAGAGREGR